MNINLKKYINKYNLVLCFIIIMFVLMIITSIINRRFINKRVVNNKTVTTSNNEVIKKKKINKEDTEQKEVTKPKVDIKGAIKNPGVYEMDVDSRVIDVINKAGGLLETANTEYINLSKKVTDEMVIIIYTNKQINIFKWQGTLEIKTINYNCPDNLNDACIVKSDSKKQTDNTNKNSSSNKESKSTNSKETSNYPININTASKEELMKLPNVGETKANSIIEYRDTNGKFNSIDDIKNVSGIGDSTFEKLKQYITV